MSDRLWPDVRLMPEVSEDSFVRAGITDFEGRLWLFVSEFRDLDVQQGDRQHPESFFLVRIPEADFDTFSSRYGTPHSRTSDPEWEKNAEQQFREWWGFRTKVLAEALRAGRAERNFQEVYLADLEEGMGPAADSGWVWRGEVDAEEMRVRLRWAEQQLRRLYGEPDGIGPGEELQF